MKTIILTTLMVSLLAGVAQAQNANITWQSPVTISGAADVSTQGTSLGSWAPYDGNADTLPVNGVAFQGYSDLPGLSTVDFDNGYNGFGSPGTPNANYNTLLQYATFANETPNSFSWDGMTPGHTYLVQIWVNDGRNIGQARSETFTGGTNTSDEVSYGSDGSGPGQYIIGQFVADSTGSETITVTPYSTGANPDAQINLLQVRDVTVGVVTNYQSAVLADNPLAYYALNPGSDPSGVSPDLTGHGNNGAANNLTAAIGPSLYITNAASFDGASSLVDLSQGSDPGLLEFNGPITLEAWVQPSSSTLFGDILAKGYDSSTYDEIVLRVNGPYGADYYGSSGSVGETGGVQTTEWTYVVLSSDGIHCSLYVNGGLVAQGPDTSGSVNFSDDWVIGDGSSGGNSRYFGGNISQVAIYGYGLSAAQVQEHYFMGMYGTNSLPTGNSLAWGATNNDGNWDTDISTNWLNLANDQQSMFNPGDLVLFDDTPGVPTGVTVNTTVTPSGITVNASANSFTFGGSGAITGAGGLTKEGSSTLTIGSPGYFTGPLTINGGAVVGGDGSIDSVSSISIATNCTLDLAGSSLPGQKPVMVSGTGLNGEGALFNSVGDYPQESMNITLGSDTLFAGSARWDFASGSQISGATNLTLDWSGGAGYSQWNSVSVGADILNIFLTNGINTSSGSSLGMNNDSTICQNPETLFTIAPGCAMAFYSGGFNASIHALSGATVYIYLSDVAFTGSNIILEDGASWISYYNSGVNTFSSAVTLNGVAHIIQGDHYMLYTNVISGPGGFVMDYYNHGMIFSASNTYSGPTIISSAGNSTELLLTNNGSISDSSLIFFGGTNSAATDIDVTGRPDQTLTLASGQILAGVGGINGSLDVSFGATISPGGTNTTIGITTGSNPTGTLSASANVGLNGTTLIKLNGSSNDIVEAGETITYGGTLNLDNISGTALAAGASFQVFNAAAHAGSFSSITPATPGSGLAWDLSGLSSGKIGVVTASSSPTIASASISGGNFLLSGTGGTANATYYIYATTNLAPANWIPVATNTYDGSGNFSASTPVVVGAPSQFYRLQQQQ